MRLARENLQFPFMVIGLAILAIIVALSMLSCSGGSERPIAGPSPLAIANTNQADGRIRINNDLSSLQARVRRTHQDIPIVPTGISPAGSPNPLLDWLIASPSALRHAEQPPIARTSLLAISLGSFRVALRDLAQFNFRPSFQSAALTVVAEVAPPTANGQVLQASSVTIQGRYAYVSYNVRGDPFLGAIDVFDIDDPENPMLVAEAIFQDSDIHSLAFAGGKIYAVQGTGDPSFDTPAAFETITVNNGELVLEEDGRIDVPSFAGTSAVTSGNRVYVTSGNTGGLAVFKRNNFQLLDQIELHDASITTSVSLIG